MTMPWHEGDRCKLAGPHYPADKALKLKGLKGTVESIDGDRVTVVLDDPPKASDDARCVISRVVLRAGEIVAESYIEASVTPGSWGGMFPS